MKRSDAIDIIAKKLNVLNGADGVAPTNLELRWANHILKDLEKAGMKPPGHGDSGLRVKNEDFYIPLYTWEPENETKS